MAADNPSAEHCIGAAAAVDTPKFGGLREGKPERAGYNTRRGRSVVRQDVRFTNCPGCHGNSRLLAAA